MHSTAARSTFTCCVTTFTGCYQKLFSTLNGDLAPVRTHPRLPHPSRPWHPLQSPLDMRVSPVFLRAGGWGCPVPCHWSVLRDLSLEQPLCPSPPQTDSVFSPKSGGLLSGVHPPQAPVLETQSHHFGFIFFKIFKKCGSPF